MTPPMMMNACTPMIVVRPDGEQLLERRCRCAARCAARRRSAAGAPSARRSRRAGPSSSPIAAKMKSFWASGTVPGLPRPRPVPLMPPSARREQRLDDLVALARRSVHGSSQIVHAVLHVAEHAPGRRSAAPANRTQADDQVAARSVATHSITTNRAKNSSDEPRSRLADHHHHGEAPGEQDRQRGGGARAGGTARPSRCRRRSARGCSAR